MRMDGWMDEPHQSSLSSLMPHGKLLRRGGAAEETCEEEEELDGKTLSYLW